MEASVCVPEIMQKKFCTASMLRAARFSGASMTPMCAAISHRNQTLEKDVFLFMAKDCGSDGTDGGFLYIKCAYRLNAAGYKMWRRLLRGG